MNTVIDGVDYGPLAALIGTWIGNKGLDRAPDINAETDETAFTDELVFSTAGGAENAEEQELVALKYQHTVRRVDNGQIFHEQIGHWLYEPKTSAIMHSLTIPRGVCVLAGGQYEQKNEEGIFHVEAKAGSDTFGIVQSPFMLEKAKTLAFEMTIWLKGDELSYDETVSLHIYGKDFEHSDTSVLQRVIYE